MPKFSWAAWRASTVLVVLTTLALAACTRTAPEQRLREAMTGLQASMEQRDVAELRSYLAEDFVGPDGIDREGARRMAQMLFLRHRDVGVRVGTLETSVQAGHATVRFTAAVTGGEGGLLPDSGQVYDVESGWREESSEWRMTSVRWTPKFEPGRH